MVKVMAIFLPMLHMDNLSGTIVKIDMLM